MQNLQASIKEIENSNSSRGPPGGTKGEERPPEERKGSREPVSSIPEISSIADSAFQNFQASINLLESKLREVGDLNSSSGPSGGAGEAEKPPGEHERSRRSVFPIHEIVESLNLPEGTKISSSDPISGPGIYIVESTISNNVYVGRSCDVTRRIREHENDMRKQSNNTVARHFRCGEFRVHSIGLSRELTSNEMRFNEQKLMDVVTSKGYNKVNVIRSMNLKDFQKMESSRL